MNSWFTILVFFFFPLFVKAQRFQIDKPALPIDSLKNVLPLLRDSARVDCMNEITRSFTETATYFKMDSALLLVKQAYTEASAIHYIKGLGDACLRYGVIEDAYLAYGLINKLHSFDFTESKKNYRQAISWYQKIEDNDGLGHGFRGLGSALRHQGSRDEAMKAYEQSVLHFRKAGNQVMLADLTDLIGLVYRSNGDFSAVAGASTGHFFNFKKF